MKAKKRCSSSAAFQVSAQRVVLRCLLEEFPVIVRAHRTRSNPPFSRRLLCQIASSSQRQSAKNAQELVFEYDCSLADPANLPLLADPSNLPLLTDLSNLPLLADPSNLPLLADLSNLPLLADPSNLPLLANLSNSPLLADLSNLPLLADPSPGRH